MSYMNKFEEQIIICKECLKGISQKINNNGVPSNNINYQNLYNELYKLSELLPTHLTIYQKRLRDFILPNLKMRDIVSYNQWGQQIIFPCTGINPYTLGEVIATLIYIDENKHEYDNIWVNIHPCIIQSSQKLFNDAHYAESVEAAFLEINVRIKEIIKLKTGEDIDGVPAMQKAFSVNSPILKLHTDIISKTGKDIQQGYMELFVGAFRCIRNPKAHEKISITKIEAIQKLHFASLLMYEIDKAKINTL
ncbi:TIGR02391 family protein [Phocaeicola vulgatus]|uniref:TIGR02391 family protein n=3 Tax=Bacteroidia TaxID=200643 RepID=A0A4S2E9S7_PARDI|nr:TIGR02391 family protein [Phocaeicola vulgatus]TGY52175.1 TIGR02391 family protein [Parabacteroides distasonis]